RAWAAIRQSEPAALAAGINITAYKLWAFALASFITGVAGGGVAGAHPLPCSLRFPPPRPATPLGPGVIGGAPHPLGGGPGQLLPALLTTWGVSADGLTILFGIGVLQVLTTAPAGLADQAPKDLARLGRLLVGRLRKLTGSVRGAR